MEIKFFDFGPILLAALFVLLGTTQQGESARVEEAAVASVDQAKAVVIPGLQAVEAKVPEVGAKVQVALDEDELYWYEVIDGRTVGTYVAYGTKSSINAAPFCAPGNAQICLFGSTEDDLDDHEVDANPNPDQVVLKAATP